MARKIKSNSVERNWKEWLQEDSDFLKQLVREMVQEVLEAEMEEALGAGKGERKEGRLGYRSGYYARTLVTRVGKLELRVPQDRQGRFSTQVFERYQRSEKALVSALAEMYVQGVSTRKVKAITEELCGHSFSASTISQINQKLDEQLEKFAGRQLEEEYPYLILDARYEKVREEGVIRSQAVLIAIGIDWEGRRNVLAVELANRESQGSWLEFLKRLRARGLHGVEFVVSDNHAGLKRAIMEVLSEAVWQRCYVHFLRNALDYLPRKADDDCLKELRWSYDRRDLQEARRDLASWLSKWQDKYPKLCDWVEENIEETFAFYRLPLQHHKHLKSTNMLERLNEEIKRRTYVVRIFPNPSSCLRLVRALAVEMHENWIEATRYLNMEFLKEHKKEPCDARRRLEGEMRGSSAQGESTIVALWPYKTKFFGQKITGSRENRDFAVIGSMTRFVQEPLTQALELKLHSGYALMALQLGSKIRTESFPLMPLTDYDRRSQLRRYQDQIAEFSGHNTGSFGVVFHGVCSPSICLQRS